MTRAGVAAAFVAAAASGSISPRGRAVVDLDDTINVASMDTITTDNFYNDNHDDDANSSTTSSQQLSARLKEMRRRVEEKQRHVASILSNVAMSIFDSSSKNNESSSEDDEDAMSFQAVQVKPSSTTEQVRRHDHQKKQHYERRSPSLGTASSSCEQTLGTSPSLYPTTTTSTQSHSHSSSNSNNDLESGMTATSTTGGGGEQGQEIEWTTTAFPSSSPSQLLLPEAAVEADAEAEAAAAARRRSHSRQQQQSAARKKSFPTNTATLVPVPVRVVSTTNTPDVDIVVCRASAAALDGPDVVVVASSSTNSSGSSSRQVHHHATKKTLLMPCSSSSSNKEYRHMQSSSEELEKYYPHHNPHHSPSSLTVPIDSGELPLQHRQVVLGKSNRKSLLAGCCCCGGGGRGNNKNNSDPDYYEEHLGEGRQYWRDIILGVNDGLVSTFLLIAGVTGAHLSSTDILLTALSGTIAGAISMAAGEYVATKTQQEVMDGEIALERKHIAKNRDIELLELKETFGIIGIPEEDTSEEVVKLRQLLMDFYAKNDEAHVKVHAVLELGVVEDEKRNPFIAGGVAFFLFFFGAMPSVIPFVCTSDINSAFIAAAIATTMALLLVGAIKTWATRGNLWLASMENLLIAAGGGGIAYGVGVGFEKIVNG